MVVAFPTREQIIQAYTRICKDSLYRMAPADAAHFVGKMLGISALEVWTKSGMDLDTMSRVANGTHPSQRTAT